MRPLNYDLGPNLPITKSGGCFNLGYHLSHLNLVTKPCGTNLGPFD